MAVSGFDLRGRGGGVDFVNEVGAGKSKSLKKLRLKLKSFLECFGHISITNMLKINLE